MSNDAISQEALIEKFGHDPKMKSAVAKVKATERNGTCPCGCGTKAKKCSRGQQVLQFKKMLQ